MERSLLAVLTARAAKQPDWPGSGEMVPKRRREGPPVTPEPKGDRSLRSPVRDKERATRGNRKPPAVMRGVSDGARTRDTQDHNLVLYLLSYAHHRRRADPAQEV